MKDLIEFESKEKSHIVWKSQKVTLAVIFLQTSFFEIYF